MSAVLQPQRKRALRWVTFQLANEVCGINVMLLELDKLFDALGPALAT